ncbi:inositol monophosphatase family protein [Planomonospora sp. ID82291]|uniref:inositol monophosphatase family protein n=1 Tax=Planomonospora sp. ID82291 TaxID=2738136 RepID=UPI0018C3F35A|nr:inositol monophosphatase family protein [Planomonospora sp. ID82291]
MVITDEELALTAAQAGATVVQAMYGAPLTRLGKSAGDFATSADIEAEKAILDVIRTARPDDAVTAEESGSTGPDGAASPTATYGTVCTSPPGSHCAWPPDAW